MRLFWNYWKRCGTYKGTADSVFWGPRLIAENAVFKRTNQCYLWYFLTPPFKNGNQTTVTVTVKVSLWLSLIISRVGITNVQMCAILSIKYEIYAIHILCKRENYDYKVFWKNAELQGDSTKNYQEICLWETKRFNCQWCRENRQHWMRTEVWLFLEFFGSSSKKQHNEIPCTSCRF